MQLIKIIVEIDVSVMRGRAKEVLSNNHLISKHIHPLQPNLDMGYFCSKSHNVDT